jgi:hypothetical protein
MGHRPGHELEWESGSQADTRTLALELLVTCLLTAAGGVLIVRGVQHEIYALVAAGGVLVLLVAVTARRAIQLLFAARRYWWDMQAAASRGPRAKRRETS